MDFSTALSKLKEGKRLQRSGWNGKGMFIFLVRYSGTIEGRQIQPYLAIKTVEDTLVPWIVSQSDLLADDWETHE